MLLRDNVFIANEIGIEIFGDFGTVISGIWMSDNSIIGNASVGISLQRFVIAEITRNNIYGNGFAPGLVTGSLTAFPLGCGLSTFDPGTAATLDDGPVNATKNFWGIPGAENVVCHLSVRRTVNTEPRVDDSVAVPKDRPGQW